MDENPDFFTNLQSPPKFSNDPPLHLSQISANFSFFPLTSLNLLPAISEIIPTSLQNVSILSKDPLIFSAKSQDNSQEIHWQKSSDSPILFPEILYTEFLNGGLFPNTPLPSLFSFFLTRPEILLRNYEKNNSKSCYFWLNDRGKWFKLTIDFSFPYIDDLYAFTLINTMISQGVYVQTLEKALAKISGSYETLFQGNSLRKLIKMVLGVPIEKLMIDEKIRETIKNSFYRGFLIFFEGKDDNFRNEGFVLLDYQEYDGGGGLYRLKASNRTVTMKICEILGDLVINTDEKSAVISMDFYGLEKIAKRANICKFHENYFHNWIELKGFQSIFRIHSETSLHLYITISFTEKTSFRFFLVKTQENIQKFEFVQGDYVNQKNLLIEDFLESGEYYILIEFLTISNGVLSLYSGNPELLLQEKSSNPKDFSLVQEQVFKDLALFRNSSSKLIFPYQNQMKTRCFSDVICGYLYVYILNQSRKRLKDKINLNKDKSLILGTEKNISLEFIDLAPNEDLIILYKHQGDFNLNSIDKYELSHDFSFEDSTIPILEDGLVMGFNSVTHEFPKRYLEKQAEKIGGKPELLKLLKEHGHRSKRIWNKKEIEVFCYTLIHETGVAFLYTNYTYFPYEENVVFELENLELVNRNEENVVRFELEPYSEFFLFLNRKDQEKPFEYKTKNYYKYYPEK